ncbi:MAG: 30S ribosome-binding factor RbfA [Planctomycetes bacterium]|jgi:ribosome-binding factor A|nr:30S ribosome-binding factor RbfA [Planctomycetota bacterium]MBT4027833.1 30S ribosome-binding factor RbfA [Planctomycetota bacterium]MBT4560435.1 30S ribosome-binding factor RbfA [Planctomycetota bacterium]MBT5100405.1 30S ribosome-binding factor RbfA [Planctomycetota bacterium]MBT5119317.1 30S ribosome-binding factor RbfA [Planctomycetota bacterium]
MASDRRRKQLARAIQQRISHLLIYEMKDPRASFVTITGVDINQDLSIAEIRYTTLESGARSKTQHMLDHAAGFLRTQIAHEIDIRSAPRLDFQYDLGAERVALIEQLLIDAKKGEPAEVDSDSDESQGPQTEA